MLQLLWDGLTMKEIAPTLGVSLSRVRWVRLSIGMKLDVSNSWQLCRKALELGLIELPKKS